MTRPGVLLFTTGPDAPALPRVEGLRGRDARSRGEASRPECFAWQGRENPGVTDDGSYKPIVASNPFWYQQSANLAPLATLLGAASFSGYRGRCHSLTRFSAVLQAGYFWH